MNPARACILAAALAAAAAALAAVAGDALLLLAALASLGLLALGALLPLPVTRTVLLLVLVLTPEAPTGRTFGLDVHWSAGLTLPNFLIPALALPLLGGAWLAGKPLSPRDTPRLAFWILALLAWGVLTLLPAWLGGALGGAAGPTLLAHAVKLALFVALGVVLAGGDPLDARCWLAIVALEAAVGLAQVAGWLPVFSPLATQNGVPRATGTFYDANMYAVLVAWALLWLLSRPLPRPALRRAAGVALALALAANLALADSRAGYFAFAVGVLLLAAFRPAPASAAAAPRPVARALVLLALLAACFPVRTWQRVRSAAVTVAADWRGSTVAPARPSDAATGARLASMRQALLQIAAHPLLGLGFGRALYLGVAPLGGGPVTPSAAGRFRGAQDMPLTVLAETGPVGLALFLAAFAAPLRRLRQARAAGSLPLLAGYAGLLAASLTLEALWNARLLALVVALTAALPAAAVPAARAPAPLAAPEAV